MRSYLTPFLALCACYLVSCSSDPAGPSGGNTNQTVAERQGPDTTATWQAGLTYTSTSPWKLDASVDQFFWQSGKLYAFGRFSKNGAGTVLTSMAQVDTSGFIGMNAVTSVGGVLVDYLSGANFDGSHIHAAFSLDDYHTALGEFNGSSWTTSVNPLHNNVSDFAATTDASYGWNSGSMVDSVEFRKFGASGMDLIKATRNFEVRGMVGHGNNLYIARYPTNLWGSPSTNVDVYNGSSWSSLEAIDGDVNALKYIGDTLYAMGWINLYKGSCPATRWTGSEWKPVLADDIAYQTDMVDMDLDKNGVYYFATKYKVYRYANEKTSLLGTFDGAINSIAVYKGRLIVTGSFSQVVTPSSQTVSSSYIAILK